MKKRHVILPVLAHIFLITLTPASSQQDLAMKLFSDEQRIIDNLLRSEDASDPYDWRVRPRGFVESRESIQRSRELSNTNDTTFDNEDYDSSDDDENPVIVTANISISEVDDVNMEYTAHFTFRQEWVDERLLFYSESLDHIILSPDQRIFLPDTFFQNEKNGKKHNIDKPNVMIRVYNGTGKVLYSCRLTLTLSCPMYLEAYPLDTQTCFIDYASYAYTTKDIIYEWKEENPIQIKVGLRQSLPSFVLSGVFIGNCTSVTTTGSYSCLRTIIRLKREFSYYLLQLYVPSFMLVVVSNVSFWLDKDSVPARVTLGTTVLLTVTTMASGINANLPPVSYTKSVDIWIGVCTGFIFGALLEFSLVNWAARKEAFSAFGQFARMRKIANQNPLLAQRHRLPMVATLANRASFSGLLPILAMNDEFGMTTINTVPPIIDHPYHPSPRSHYHPHITTNPSSTLAMEHKGNLNGGFVQRQAINVANGDDESVCDVGEGAVEFSVAVDASANPQHINRRFGARFEFDVCRVCGWLFHCRRWGVTRWWRHIWNNRYREKSKRIDLLARILFPFFFVIFNFIYWARYLRPYLAVKSEMEEDL